MPSGYTAPLYDGDEISPRELALRFARGMGFSIVQRDEALESPPRLREVSSYYISRVNELNQRLAWLQSATNGQLHHEQRKRRNEIIDANRLECDRHERLTTVYTQAIDVYEAWRPATGAGQGVRQFALTQLRESLAHDAGDKPFMLDVPDELDVDDYRKQQLDDARRKLDLAEQSLADERKRVHEFNEKIQDALTDIERLRDVQW